jgi:RND family efflux transporter MFP subunit
VQAILAAAAALGTTVAVLGCAEEPPPPEPVVRPVKMLTIGGGLAGTREYPGRIKAVLARLDPRDYQNQLEQAKAIERNRRTYLARIAEAHREKAVSDQDLADAQAQVEVAKADVRIKQKALDDAILRAPFEGVMARKLVEDFANVQAKEPVLILEDDSLLEIKVSLPERDLAGRRPSRRDMDEVNERIQPKVVATSLPDDVFPARLKELATTADPTTRTFEATFQFEQPEEVVVLPGMTAKVVIRIGDFASASDVSLPSRAVVDDGKSQPMVWIVDPDTSAVESRSVTVGQLADDQILVTEGLQDGDNVVISGMSQLRPGMKVRRWER